MSIISTKRLVLRPFREDDLEAVYNNWTHDERVARYCRWYPHESIDETKAYLDFILNEAKCGFDYRWAITVKGDEEPVGCIDVTAIEEDGKTAHIGYLISHKYWNKGYMTEAFSAVIEFLFEHGFECIKAEHHIDNPASGKVMEKCGMKFVGTDFGPSKFGSDELCEVKCYEIKK